MRVALIHRDLHAVTRGGICTLYLALAAELAAAGHHVTLITQETPHPVSAQGVEVHTLPRTDNLTTHSSPCRREPGLTRHTVEDLREPDYGTADGAPWASVVAAFGKAPALHPNRPIAPGAEPWLDHLTRVRTALTAIPGAGFDLYYAGSLVLKPAPMPILGRCNSPGHGACDRGGHNLT